MAKGSNSFEDFNTLLTEINSKQIAPVYLLHGEEFHFLELLLTAIEKNVLDESTQSFNHHVFYGKDSNVTDIANVCRRFPMMADYQLVVVKEAQMLSKPELIIPYLENSMPQTVLVWYHPSKKLAMNRKPGTAFKKLNHKVFTADPIHEKLIADVVMKFIVSKGYDIEPKPLHLLLENSANKFSKVVQELAKVFANVEPGNKIRDEHIQKFVGINKEYNIFSLQKALAERNNDRALEIMKYYSSHLKENPLPMVTATLFSYFKKVAIVQTLTRSSDKEIMAQVGVPWFAVSEYKMASRNYGRAVEKAIEIINDCDLKFKGIKQNTGNEKSLFEETILKILSL